MNIRRLHPEHEPPLDLLLTADPSEKLVIDYLKRGQCYTAEIDRRIVGVYVLLPTRPETAELVNIAVKEDLQGKGIGRQLVMHAIETAKAQGFKTIEIGTGNSSIGQLALYQKCGFRITGIDRNFFLRHYEKPIYENGMRCIDMVPLAPDLSKIRRAPRRILVNILQNRTGSFSDHLFWSAPASAKSGLSAGSKSWKPICFPFQDQDWA